jgi:hypothetical protein
MFAIRSELAIFLIATSAESGVGGPQVKFVYWHPRKKE